jgi:hypothetical protein
MDEKYLETIKRLSNPSHSEIMRNVFNPTSEAELEMIKEFNKTAPQGSKAFISTKNPQWTQVGAPEYPVKSKYSTTGIEAEASNPFVKSPAAQQYKEAIFKIKELDRKIENINAFEKGKYQAYPESYEDKVFTNPKYKKFGEETLRKYDTAKPLLEETRKSLSPEDQKKYSDKLEEMFNDLVGVGKFQKA